MDYAGCKSSTQEQRKLADLIAAHLPTVNLHQEASFTSAITHLVAPANSATTKLLVATLTHCWILPPQWVYDSVKARKILPEKEYGTRSMSEPFRNQKVYLSQTFYAESAKSFTPVFYRQLITQVSNSIPRRPPPSSLARSLPLSV
jgi:hypothetical protein